MGIMGTLREDQCTFLILSGLVLRMRNVTNIGCRAKENTLYTQ
jgi:hypothetical protein